MSPFDAIILAGGRGSRLGGVEKAGIVLAGDRLIDRAVTAAVQAGAVRVIVVGPEHQAPGATHTVREDPPFSGPLPAIIAGLTRVHAEHVMLLACDIVNPGPVCELLARHRPQNRESTGVVLRDVDGYPQWLASMHRTRTLRAAAAEIEDASDERLRRIFSYSKLEFVRASPRLTRDIDTPDDLQWARSGIHSR